MVAVEGLIIYYFEQLQCAKFNIKQKDCHVGLVLGQVQFLTIPEGYRCYVSQFKYVLQFKYIVLERKCVREERSVGGNVEKSMKNRLYNVAAHDSVLSDTFSL